MTLSKKNDFSQNAVQQKDILPNSILEHGQRSTINKPFKFIRLMVVQLNVVAPSVLCLPFEVSSYTKKQLFKNFEFRPEFQHNKKSLPHDTQNNDIQHNDTQHNHKIIMIRIIMLDANAKCRYVKCRYEKSGNAECC